MHWGTTHHDNVERRGGRLWPLTPVVALIATLCWPVVGVLASSADRAPRQSSYLARDASHHPLMLAELRVSSASVKLAEGGTLAGTAIIENAGAARARATTAGVAWKSSATHGSIQLGRFAVPALKPGQHHKDAWHLKLPSDAAAGVYDVTVCADLLSQVHEASKKHQCRSAGTVTFTPGSGVKGYGPEKEETKTPTTTTSEPTKTTSGPPPSSGPPTTAITSGPSGLVGTSTATFTFSSSQADSTFQCSLDGAPWAACTSPQTYTALAEGAHTFEVRAVNAAGEVDPTPASASFTVEATPPQTTITSAPSGRVPIGEVSISFASTEAGSSFQCSLDGAATARAARLM
jgi:hypothetical protein